MQEATEVVRCQVCGQPCMTEPGRFSLPLQDITSGRPIEGICCGVCGPKINAFCESEEIDLDLLPKGGPLRGFLEQQLALQSGMRCLQILTFLANRLARVEFREGSVVVTINGASVSAPTLEEAIEISDQAGGEAN